MERPKTAEEIAALPIGPLQILRHEVTERDRARGFCIIHGRAIPCPGTQFLNVPIMPEVRVVWSEDDEPFSYIDASGDMWTLGQYADGTYFRQRVY